MFKYSAKLLKGYADLKYDTFKKKKKKVNYFYVPSLAPLSIQKFVTAKVCLCRI